MTRHGKGRAIHPVDIDLSQRMRDSPGQWFAYPAALRWPDVDPTVPKMLRTLAYRLHVRCYSPFGVYTPTEDGIFRVRLDAHAGQLDMRYLPTTEEPTT